MSTKMRQRAAAAATAAIGEIDQEIEKIRTAAADAIGGLRQERSRFEAVTLPNGKKTTKARASKPRTTQTADQSRHIAGPTAIAKVEKFLRTHPGRRAFQSQITKGTGLNSGTVTHALRALASDSKIAVTGESLNGSAEFQYLGRKSAPREAVPA